MALNAFVQLPTDGTGKQVATSTTTGDGRHRHQMVLADPQTDNAVVGVVNTQPVKSDYGLPVRVIGGLGPDAAPTGATWDAEGQLTGTTAVTLASSDRALDSVMVCNYGTLPAAITLKNRAGTPLFVLNGVILEPNSPPLVLKFAGLKMTSGVDIQTDVANQLNYIVKGRQ